MFRRKLRFIELSFVQGIEKCSHKISKIKEINAVFVPNTAIFILERNLIGEDFRQPLLSSEHASHSQHNAINCNFRQASSKHF